MCMAIMMVILLIVANQLNCFTLYLTQTFHWNMTMMETYKIVFSALKCICELALVEGGMRISAAVLSILRTKCIFQWATSLCQKVKCIKVSDKKQVF
jgi:hypothetical protein